MKSTLRDDLLVGILLVLFCSRIWGLGITHTDDAVWALRAWDTPGNIFLNDPVGDWARWQGRFWAFVSGALMLHTLKWQGTIYGEVLRLAAYAGFFAAFHGAVRAFCGRRIALLAAVLNIGLVVLRWDGSIFTTYPLITWVAGIAFCVAMVAARAYVAGGDRILAVAASVLLFFSFMNNEGVTAAFMLLALLGAWAVRRQAAAHGVPGATARGTRLVGVAVLACGAYAALYLGWRLSHPSQYVGNQVAWLGVRSFLTTWWHFSTGGSVLHDLVWPYKVVYVDVQAATGHEQVYRVWAHWRDAIRSPGAWTAAALSGFLVLRSVRTAAGTAHASVFAVVAGLSICAVVVAPVALTSMYQGWVMEKGVRAYSHTPLAHFGWSLVLAGVLSWALGEAGRRRIAACCLALIVAVLAALASATNDVIADDMRPEAGRWRVLKNLLDANAAGPKERTLLAPRYANGSWYVWVPYGFWWQYAYWRWDEENTRVYTQVPSPPSSAGWSMVADYGWEGRRRGFTGLMARLHPRGESPPPATAAVFTEGGSASLEGLVLVYPGETDLVRQTVTTGERVHRGRVDIALVDLPDVDWVRLEREGAASPYPLIELDLRSGRVKNWTWPTR